MPRRPDKWCAKCGRIVTHYHEHWGRAERVAWPEIAQPQDDEGKSGRTGRMHVKKLKSRRGGE